MESSLSVSSLGSLIEKQRRKTNGVFYTPPALTDLIIDWGVRSEEDRILDPSFGGAAFLRAAHRRLIDLGSKAPATQLFGVDINSSAGRGPVLTLNLPASHLRQVDFMSLRPSDLPKVDAVVGNPPWVRHQLLARRTLLEAHAAISSEFAGVSRRSSYWVYFLLHAMQFLSPGARLGFVLPWSFKQSDYAEAVRAHVKANFGVVSEEVVDERHFVGVDEPSIILLADGYGRPNRVWATVDRPTSAKTGRPGIRYVPEDLVTGRIRRARECCGDFNRACHG